MNLLKKATMLLASLAIVSGVLMPVAVVAQTPQQDACEGLKLTGGSCGGSANTEVQDILTTVINIFSFIVGVTAVIMIIIGGLRYITSGGDASNTKAAKDTILYAIIGMVIAVLAQVIVRFVLGRVG